MVSNPNPNPSPHAPMNINKGSYRKFYLKVAGNKVYITLDTQSQYENLDFEFEKNDIRTFIRVKMNVYMTGD